jgi:hypothetical protein
MAITFRGVSFYMSCNLKGDNYHQRRDLSVTRELVAIFNVLYHTEIA